MTAVGALAGADMSSIGFEAATRAMRLVMLEQLNDEIDAQAAKWEAADLQLQALGLDPGVGQVEVDHVEPSNLHEGPHLSMLQAPADFFPNVSMMAAVARPAANRFAAQLDTSQITIAFEAMVKAGPVADDDSNLLGIETIVHRRIQRMTEAVNAVARRNPTMLGVFLEMSEEARGGVGQISQVHRVGGTGPRYLWQGSRLEYTARRASIFD